ncbi:hypothetical protein Lalb_Chr21g0315181 [Lupinus albus]|uniref:Uncharacterized protein n=1 Tax=Lupinus albus TaxID=3870 RepID=A0A6A4N7P3_LUPAL|nr:hypothetical protein Lalb_Chr21g0315181 [Lupinus albus]
MTNKQILSTISNPSQKCNLLSATSFTNLVAEVVEMWMEDIIVLANWFVVRRGYERIT